MKKLKLTKLEYLLYESVVKNMAAYQPVRDNLYFVIMEELLAKTVSITGRKEVYAKISIRQSECTVFARFLMNLGIANDLLDVTRNNLIEKLTKLYDGK